MKRCPQQPARAVPRERSLHTGVPSQSLHPILCVAHRGDNFSFQRMDTEKRKGKRNVGGSGENSAPSQSSSSHQAPRGAPRRGTAGQCLQPRCPIAHGSRAVSPEVQHITDMTQMYSLFITSYSVHCNLRGQEGREGAVGQVRQERGGCVNIKPVLQTHRCLSSRQKEKEGKTPRC